MQRPERRAAVLVPNPERAPPPPLWQVGPLVPVSGKFAGAVAPDNSVSDFKSPTAFGKPSVHAAFSGRSDMKRGP